MQSEDSSFVESLSVVKTTPLKKLAKSHSVVDRIRRRIVDNEEGLSQIGAAEFNSSI